MRFEDFARENCLFHTEELGGGITLITDYMGVGMYLVCGEKKAALLDTGLGIGALRPVIDDLTSLPVEVYLTHGHVDHCGGMFDFDKVHVSGEDLELLREHSKPRLRLDFAIAYAPVLGEIPDILDHMPYRQVSLSFIRPGQKIDLGGRILKVVDLKGHTQGSVGYWDSATGTLFAGDGCNNSTFLFLRESSSVEEYLGTLRKWKAEWADKTTRIMICHDKWTGAPLTMVDDLIEACEHVLRGQHSGIPFKIPYEPFQNGPAFWAAAGESARWELDGKFGNLIFSESTPC